MIKVIEARLNEILEIIQKQLMEIGIDQNFKNDVFITILKILTPFGWQFIKKDYNNMINKKK